jgi:hypothetical protein
MMLSFVRRPIDGNLKGAALKEILHAERLKEMSPQVLAGKKLFPFETVRVAAEHRQHQRKKTRHGYEPGRIKKPVIQPGLNERERDKFRRQSYEERNQSPQRTVRRARQ